MNIVTAWFRRVLTDTQAVVLLLVLVACTTVILLAGKMLAPILAGVVIAYLLEGLVSYLSRTGLPRFLAVLLVFALFCAVLVFLVFGLLPLVSGQLTQLVQALPNMLVRGQEMLMALPEKYPSYITELQVIEIISSAKTELGNFGQHMLSYSLASVVGLITVAIYLVLLPLIVFFFLKDKALIIAWFRRFLPKDHRLAKTVWHEVDLQMVNYVRGKFWEIIIVWSASFATFTFMQLQFGMLLSLMVGLSVIIPYIGAALVTFPVAIVALFQWGWTSEFMWLMVAYSIIQAVDGNVIVPLLFSEVVDLHPIAIVGAVLVFGGIWGFWGVFFAIPLATVVQAVLKAWPRRPNLDELIVEGSTNR